jgi:uncharacterized protein (TIGR00369 family)
VTEEHFRKLERMYASAPINEYFRPVLTVSERTAVVEIPIRTEFFHAASAVHGSVYFKALDDAAYFAVNSIVTDAFIVTVQFNIYLTRPVSEGVLRATGYVVHESRSLFIANAELTANGREIARGSGTFMRSSLSAASQ